MVHGDHPVHKKKKLPPLLIVIVSFLAIILFGSIVLALPISVQDGRLPYVDALFLSASAVCVTGLTTIADLGATLSVFGKFFLALLIQIGGLGIVTIAIYVLVLLGIRIGVMERVVVREALNQNSLQGMVRLVKAIVLTSLAFEFVGMWLNLIVFSRDYPFWTALGYSAFHAVSSFNNAGFDLLGATSLIPYADDLLLNLNTAFLVIVGGIGFIVIFDLLKKRSWKGLTNYSKIVLRTTGFLLVAGTLLLKLAVGSEITWLQAFFQSFTARTSGFATVDLSRFGIAGLSLMILLMFIGASPNSTGGGIKTTTAYTIYRSTIAFLTGKSPIIKNRRIDDETRIKALTLAFLAVVVVFVGFLALVGFEQDNIMFASTPESLLFEAVSAFGTVGLSTGVTPFLSTASKLVVVVVMFIGRLGPITIFGFFNRNWGHPYASATEYPAEKVLIG
ncbi:MAG: potassium transporter TrkG [Candidatus Izemoplasmatales bacterium]